MHSQVRCSSPARSVTVESPLYRYSFSTVGARLESAELPRFEALNRDGVVDLVPDDVLRKTPEALAEAHRRDWRSLFAV